MSDALRVWVKRPYEQAGGLMLLVLDWILIFHSSKYESGEYVRRRYAPYAAATESASGTNVRSGSVAFIHY